MVINLKSLIAVVSAALTLLYGFLAVSATTNLIAVSEPQEAIPPNIVSISNKPMMMLASSKDHTLFSPIYTDYEDIDGDGMLDTAFKPAFKYYGYFDATKCYQYNQVDRWFEPHSLAIRTNDGRYTCSDKALLWSGNFMNWVTMTRLDVVRKMLYGGKRSADGYLNDKDGASVTVLERANLSWDAHSFAKHYAGTDVRDYTPFTVQELIKTTGVNANKYAGLTMCNMSSEYTAYGNPQIRLAKGNYSMWGTIDYNVCRWENPGEIAAFGAKLSRYFIDQDKGNGLVNHEMKNPDAGADGLFHAGTANLIARVRVCVPGLIGEERCQAFPADSEKNFKPYGIFQEFGLGSSATAVARAEFGVITGSYDNNLKAGALRKNIGDFSDEVNASTGVFCHSPTSGCLATLTDGRKTGTGAIKSIDSFILFGRGNGGVYEGTGNWNPQLPNEMVNGVLSAWGNPIGEMVVQAFNYFAGSANSNPTTTTKDTSTGLSVVPWQDPLSSANTDRVNKYGLPICRPMYTLALSSSALSFDADANADFALLPNRALGGLSSYVDLIGEQEGIHGTERSVGSVAGAASFGESCAKKSISSLSTVSGVCPEAPAVGGTYQVAGASLYANTSQIRNRASLGKLPADSDKVKDFLKVKTLAASLAGGVPRIEVPIPNKPGKFVYIMPESLWNSNKRMPGGILAFKSINSGYLMGANKEVTGTYASFIVTWNDALFGGDYDMDLTGFLRYETSPDPNAAGQYKITVITDIVNVGGGFRGTHGFSIMGTDNDGRYLTHEHKGNKGTGWVPYYSNDPLKGADGYMCDTPYEYEIRCDVSRQGDSIVDRDSPYRMTFKMRGVDDVILQDPLWYAAKYGYFNSSVQNADGTFTDLSLPPNKESWDSLLSDGSPGMNGVPDGYFLARRPDILEEQLRRALNVVANTSNAAPAISTTVLTEGALKYTVRFDSANATGQLEAYKLLSDGSFAAPPTWEAGALLQARVVQGEDREIITNDGSAGVPFRWNLLSGTYQAQMTTASTNKLSAANARIALEYIRGDQHQEGAGGLRVRGANLLGAIVNSSPWVQQRPMASWGTGVDDYGVFYEAQRKRKSVLWLGANDGMLHAFQADTGRELFAYVPGALANRLAEIPLQRSGKTRLDGVDFVSGIQVQPSGTVWPYVDGNAFTADVKVGAAWKTYVFGTLGRGGRGVFALDASRIEDLTERNAATVFKWQFTSTDDADLGYQTGDVKVHLASNQATPIARLNNGAFAMILGNGQRSVSGKAVLFILYMDGPDGSGSWSGRYKKIVVDAGKGNGLSTPRWEDVDGNGTADIVYAGDLKGNVWKFDLSSSNPNGWAPAFGAEATIEKMATPLFTASLRDGNKTVVQPITSAPELVYMAQGGILVNVATGNAFSAGDFGVGAGRQSVYGIWDRGRPLGNPSLLRRSYQRLASGAVVAEVASSIDWERYQGWAIDLPSGGEAVLTDPSFDAGVLSFVSTRPEAVGVKCNTLPSTTLYTIDPISGMPERVTQGYVQVDGMQLLVAGKDIGDPKVRMVTNKRPPPRGACRAGDPGCNCVGSDCTKEAPPCGPGQRSLSAVGRGADATICYSVAPRLQWREIPGLRTYPD